MRSLVEIQSNGTAPHGRWRGSFVTALLVVLLGTFASRLTYIQYFAHAQMSAKAIRQHGRLDKLAPRAGDVLDVCGRPLATSMDSASVYVNPKAIPASKRQELADSLALVLGIDSSKLLERLEQHTQRRFLWVKRRIHDDEARAIRDLRWPPHWVGLQPEMRRSYPQGMLASHVIGLRDIDGKARDGIERMFDPLLAGTPGQRITARDARGKTLAIADHLTQLPEPGSSVVLTIDSVIQTIVEESLDRAVAEWKPVSATGIVMDPRNGEILALANRPAVDLENPAAATVDAWVNRAVSDCYEPGSTFKPFIVAAALDWNVVQPEDQIDCHQGVYKMGPRILHSHHRNGILSVPEVVVKSDNIGMAIIGERLTNAGLYQAVRSFGFGRPTGIELPGEVGGAVRALHQWTPFYSTGSVPMGQELSVTPLQLITAFSALANGGYLLRPRIVRAVVGPNGNQLVVFHDAEVVSRPVRSETAQYMVEQILTAVVERGTGRRARLADYSVFGKTGTAQKQSPHGGYERGRYISSFIAGAPARDPRLVVLVVLNDPSKGPEPFGGKVAAPAVADILHRSLVYLGVPPDSDGFSDQDTSHIVFTD